MSCMKKEELSFVVYTSTEWNIRSVKNRSDSLGTVNMVIFVGGKFRENVVKTFHVGGVITILLFP